MFSQCIKHSNSISTLRSWGAILTLTLATFIVVTTEMLPVGLLTPIANQFSISIGLSGLLMTLPAVVAAICSPLVILFTEQIDRKKLLILGALLLVVCNLLAAITSHFTLLLIGRLFIGLCIGIIWAIAGGIAPRLVASAHVNLATSMIFGGVAAASVVGIPLGVFMGEWWDWRSAFFLMSALSCILLLLMVVLLPSLPTVTPPSANAFIAQLKRPTILLGLAITLLLVSGHFMVFTYIRPLLVTNIHATGEQLSIMLFFYGIAGIFGNFIFGLTAGKKLNLSLFIIITIIIACLFLLAILPLTTLIGGLTIIAWGMAYGGVSVTLMTWMITHSLQHIEITGSLYIAFFNAGIALGSALGSMVVFLYGLSANLIIAVLLLTTALLALAIYHLKTH
ncbi:MFS transporter [Providencia rettgeri]|uniref:MFS transporter n=1 Tax=Providencia TaxID=586 RepID=UPI0022704FBD|nr:MULTISPECIES: MFS transporter [Providencia]MCX9123572.1 MFS transporter [Providencia rettgeri]MCX9127582.1 MFS transporter [Providencia rettgeri]HEM6843939.1 MFS transporter [Providencia rettgeri]